MAVNKLNIHFMFQHKHLPELTCEILGSTKNGYKVRQYEKKPRGKVKEKITFYNSVDFSNDRGFWIKKV